MTDKELDILMLSEIDVEALIRELHDKIAFLKEVSADCYKKKEKLSADATLTPEEREAVEWAAMRSDADAQMIAGEFYAAAKNMRARSATLRKLLERLT